MVAGIEIRSFHGGVIGTPGSDNAVDLVNPLRFKRGFDNDSVASLDPLLVPPVGVATSWRKQIRFHVLTDPANSISNLRLLKTAGSLPSGYRILCQKTPTTSYTPASVSDESAQAVLVPAMEDVNSGLSFGGTGTLVINAGIVMSTGSAPTYDGGTPANQDYVVLQLEVPSSPVTTGPIGPVTLVYRYDEA